jgi:hypothetical protein
MIVNLPGAMTRFMNRAGFHPTILKPLRCPRGKPRGITS